MHLGLPKATGKRGAARIGYAYLEAYRTVLLILAYPKNEKDDLSAQERRLIRELIDRVERQFSQGLIQ